MSAHYLLEWQFSPADSFEARRTVSAPKWKAVIESGRIELRIEASDYPADHSLRHSLQHELDCRFKALQVLNHRKYTLTGPRAVFVDADGRKHYRTFADCGGFAAVGASVDLIARDPDGNVVRNTKQERISRQNGFADLAARHATDAVATSLLQIYVAAVNDPQNELVHLYEVRDALSKRFGGDSEAQTALGITYKKWKTLGHLANRDPLNQGRHRGKQIGNLRDATQKELSEARAITGDMIERYLLYLDRLTSQPQSPLTTNPQHDSASVPDG